MEIYGLVGKSGTGKSYQSLSICRERGIPCLIDDGLFIGQNRIYGGKSAKRAGTKIGAVKTALFSEDIHKEEVVKAIRKRDPESILILGTSDKMIYRIAERLELPKPKELIKIEDVCSEEDIMTAQTHRSQSGKHAIPVATFQLKREFSGYFLRPLKIFRRVGSKSTMVAEKSEVRPTFSYLGGYTISERAVYDIIKCAVRENKSVQKITGMDILKEDAGMGIYMDVIMKYGIRVKDAAEEMQAVILKEVEELTGFHIIGVNITIKGLA
ncbi:MAG: Asp23/Gls24 family envelope stress response protein [Firmicutes bacterium]|nr:Asp23/Gls24 family envelope stress response protein [Bacillota bacterium]